MTQTPYTPEKYREIEVKGFDASQFTTEQKFYQSKDGTKVPMFIVHRKARIVHSYMILNMCVRPGIESVEW